MTIGTWLFTKMRGELVGTDAEGNRYFQHKRVIAGRRRKRWVMYNGVAEASRVPADWHGWLHYTTNALPPAGGARSEEHTSELQSQSNLVCRLLLEKKKKKKKKNR